MSQSSFEVGSTLHADRRSPARPAANFTVAPAIRATPPTCRRRWRLMDLEDAALRETIIHCERPGCRSSAGWRDHAQPIDRPCLGVERNLRARVRRRSGGDRPGMVDPAESRVVHADLRVAAASARMVSRARAAGLEQAVPRPRLYRELPLSAARLGGSRAIAGRVHHRHPGRQQSRHHEPALEAGAVEPRSLDGPELLGLPHLGDHLQGQADAPRGRGDARRCARLHRLAQPRAGRDARQPREAGSLRQGRAARRRHAGQPDDAEKRTGTLCRLAAEAREGQCDAAALRLRAARRVRLHLQQGGGADRRRTTSRTIRRTRR